MRNKRLHTLTIIMGVITALVMVCSQLFFFEVVKYAKKDVKTEKHEQQNDDDDSYISLPSFSQPTSSTHVSLNHKPFCLFEILFENGKAEVDTHTVPLSLGKFLQTLFRVIISPNAP
jgi:H+/gluconate symporter-like permease